MTTRARKDRILVALNTLGGKVVDIENLSDGTSPVYDQESGTYIHVAVALADHDHEIGDMTLVFDNALI